MSCWQRDTSHHDVSQNCIELTISETKFKVSTVHNDLHLIREFYQMTVSIVSEVNSQLE